jgi:hypothetical protein
VTAKRAESTTGANLTDAGPVGNVADVDRCGEEPSYAQADIVQSTDESGRSPIRRVARVDGV